jgi:UDP-N-acetylmuramate--alanine ligase
MNTSSETAEKLISNGGGRLHLMGLAGVGMAGLAAHLHWLGFEVSGCDLKENRLSAWLRGLGVAVARGHDPRHLPDDLSALIRSTAVPDKHPELAAARADGIPILRRGEVLAAIVNSRRAVTVCGTHGKTSTTAMLAQALRGAGIDAAFFVGAEVDRLGGVAGRGEDILLAEADESDGTLRAYRPDYCILTNADIDHLEHYAGEDDLWDCFATVVKNTTRSLIFNADDPRARRIAASHPNALSYGFGAGAGLQAANYRQDAKSCRFDLLRADSPQLAISLPLPGLHNASNALAVCALAQELGVDMDCIARELGRYSPPRRRFERVCSLNGAEIYMDYSHHPAEIRALLQSVADMGKRRLLAIFQPHRYTRTLALGRDFPAACAGIDQLIIAPVFAASESPIAGGTSADLLQHFKASASMPVTLAEDLEDAWQQARSLLRAGDMLLLIGAGDIELIADWAGAAAGANPNCTRELDSESGT